MKIKDQLYELFNFNEQLAKMNRTLINLKYYSRSSEGALPGEVDVVWDNFKKTRYNFDKAFPWLHEVHTLLTMMGMDSHRMASWMLASNTQFDNKTPQQMIDGGNVENVIDYIKSIVYR